MFPAPSGENKRGMGSDFYVTTFLMSPMVGRAPTSGKNSSMKPLANNCVKSLLILVEKLSSMREKNRVSHWVKLSVLEKNYVRTTARYEDYWPTSPHSNEALEY